MHLVQVLRSIRESSLSEAEKGTKFELLMLRWLMADPIYGEELSDVWLWQDFPARKDFGNHDLGIDLVARTKLGNYWAIQCKFYDQNTSVDKAAVDSFISNSSRTFCDPFTGIQKEFEARYWISTSDYFNANAEEIVKHQQIHFHRITLDFLEHSSVDWEALYKGFPESRHKKEPQDHQKIAVEKAEKYFESHSRGKLIMACGTGKSYTALLIAEKLIARTGSVLVLIPSISLVNQMLNVWMTDKTCHIKPICICSDPNSSNRRGREYTENLTELALPATTDSQKIAERYLKSREALEQEGWGLIVIFSTYQSIDAVFYAQQAISEKMSQEHIFDLIVCDEAHRTTGIIKPDEGRSDFTKIHDANFIHGKKRLYMTATPRLYADNVKVRVAQSDYELCSMDDEKLYGEEIYCVSFGYAVVNRLLTDYKVIVLTVGSEYQLPEDVRNAVEDADNKELNFDLACRLVGCINGLAKNTTRPDNVLLWNTDPRIMRRAIAFCPNINKKGDPASSTNTARQLPQIAEKMFSEMKEGGCRKIKVTAEHIDGTMDAGEKAKKLATLSEEIPDEQECRVLCNVRCLSEGIDVPALDAAIFLSPRNSQVDVVQSVGRVMRNFRKGHADEKKFGYIIIPVVVNPNIPPEEALNDNQSFAVVWSILNALRSHDERFNAMINSIALNNAKPDKIVVDTTPFINPSPDTDTQSEDELKQLQKIEEKINKQLSFLHDIGDKIYAKMVEKVGSRLYWERWARDIAPLARNIIGRITELIAMPGKLKESFSNFVNALRASINNSISETQAVEMLGQHLVTRPVFEALFKEYNFDKNNAVSRAMRTMADNLEAHGLAKDTVKLNDFYESVKLNLGTVRTLAGKQSVIKNLYDSFFKGAFPKAVEQLGIVYTPVECVDFILYSVDAVLRREFNVGLTSKGVSILDPFAGTGTFITRLLQSGLIKREDLRRKYLQEIYCNEIVLLAYYVADVNIESVYHDISGSKEFLRFDGISLTDTFELTDKIPQPALFPILKDNLETIERQQKATIRVIVGNPPYSAGQKSGNDNAQNLKYPELDKRIEDTYVKAVKTTNKNSLYDSYIRAFRWATDRLKKSNEGGVIGFVTNGGWLDGNAAAGFRKCLEEEFSSIYVFHLRGDARTQGELRRKEGDGVFGYGSRAPAVISILVYNPAHQGKARISYCDIGDYLTRRQKLEILEERRHIFDKKMNWQEITPNKHGDWLKQRSDLFGSFIVIGDKKDKKNNETFFEPVYSNGLKTQRDAWCWNFSKSELEQNIKMAIDFYNEQCAIVAAGHDINRDPKLFSWSDNPLTNVQKNKHFDYNNGSIRNGQYRPFVESNIYLSRELNERVYQIPNLFPTANTENKIICVNGTGGKKDFSCLITNKIPDLEIIEKSQCFPLYSYKPKSTQQGELLNTEQQYERKDGITGWILRNIRGQFGNARAITKETIFYYAYGILHSPDYRKRFNDDLKKSLPRIPIVEKAEDFIAFSEAGRKLAELHLNYEKAAPCEKVYVAGTEKNNFHVEKMKFAGKQGAWDKSRIIYNSSIEISNIPLKAYEYMVNGRSAIEWIMESYRVKTDKDSGIINDPNKWMEEHNNPSYILDLLLSVIGLSLETLDIVEKLPKME